VPPPGTAGEPITSAGEGKPIADLALSLVGAPYRYGGDNPDQGFDCSGLVYYTYRSYGQAVPRTSQEQFDSARKIPLEQAAAGDLLFFRGGEILSHVGIYLGNGRFVHAPSSGGVVRVASLDSPYYRLHLIAVGRMLPEQGANPHVHVSSQTSR
jgi:cell wall-associated NlpC family hydrolase